MSNNGGNLNGGGDENASSNEQIRTVGSSSRNIAERLNSILMEGDGDGDLLMQEDERENNMLQWLQALDWQVMGACRADERLKPFLKINSSVVDAAEDRLLAHLTQHFEASEVGLLARCLCVPLVSMRVGKVIKQGPLLCPTSLRGTLNLALLPSSDLRLSFTGDDGQTERLARLTDVSADSTVTIEKIPADQSGRSFLVKVPDGETFYFWCSERSELLGFDLLSKMNDFLQRKPTLAELTGISKSRLECFASHLRAYLVGPTASSIQASSAASTSPWDSIDPGQSSSTSVRSLRNRGFQASKGNIPQQGSLSPRPGSFKESVPKTLSSLRSFSKDKLRRRGELHLPGIDSSFKSEAVPKTFENGEPSEASGINSTSPLTFLESLEKCTFPTPQIEPLQLPPISSLYSPYYCWCPPCSAPVVAPLGKSPTSFSEAFSLPPLPSLLPATVTTDLLPPIPPLDLKSFPFELPPLLSDPLVGLPFTKQCSQPIPTFTPLMCDSIVHIPVLDVCSLGQGYLVSTGPGIATSIPPLHPQFIGPIMPEGESLLEKGARETLRLLIGSSSGQVPTSLIGVRPSVLGCEDKQGIVITGSRGLYSGISDVNAIVSSFNAMGISGLKSYGASSIPDVFEQTSCGQDFQNSTYMSREEEED